MALLPGLSLGVLPAPAGGPDASLGPGDRISRPTPRDRSGDPRRLALLVGCTAYPHLDEAWRLQGPANDVRLFEDLLANEAFRFDPAAIRPLVDSAADPRLRPTRENIAREFRRLADVARTGDDVLILLAGHGSRQPADEHDGEDRESDGLDEIFLPSDVKGWNGKEGRVENAISDDEIHAWIGAIRRRGAFVWLIVDACHSATLVRGRPTEVDRRIPPEVLISREALARAAERSRQARGGGRRGAVLDPAQDAGGLVSLAAARPEEAAPELPLPGPGAPRHGLLSYTVAQVLSESSSPLTHRELAERVTAHYRAMGRWQPTPVLEGGPFDREVLGLKEWPDRPRILLHRQGEGRSTRLRVTAGALQGLSPGSILLVHPPAGAIAADEPLGHLRVASVGPLEATVEPVAHDGVPAPAIDRLPAGSRCSIALLDYGERRLAVALQSQPAAAAPTASESPAAPPIRTYPPGAGPPPLERVLAELESDPSHLLRRTGSAAEADWYVRWVGDEVWLVPASGWSGRPGRRRQDPESPAMPPPQFLVGRMTAQSEPAANLGSALRRIARARQLLRLAAFSGASLRTRGAAELEVRVELVRFQGKLDHEGSVLPHGSEGRVLGGGERIAFEVTNRSPAPVDVTLLLVDSGYGIQALYPAPRHAEYNRLQDSERLRTGVFVVTEDTLGPEQLVVIAVRSQGGPPVDFSHLEQPTLEPAGAAAQRHQRPVDSPLAQLLHFALYGAGTKRGLPPSALDDYVVRLLEWRTVPAVRSNP